MRQIKIILRTKRGDRKISNLTFTSVINLKTPSRTPNETTLSSSDNYADYAKKMIYINGCLTCLQFNAIFPGFRCCDC